MTDEIIELRKHYRNVFGNSSGKVVFHDMMLRAGFFDDIHPDDKEAVGRRNFMAETMKIIGAYGEDPMAVTKAVCDVLLSQPIQITKGDEDNA